MDAAQAVQDVPSVKTVKIFPIITHFLGAPVRFFPMTFEIEMRTHYETSSRDKNQAMWSSSYQEIRCRYDTQSFNKIPIETWAIPFPDYCKSINYSEEAIKRIIKRNNDTFKTFYRVEPIPDALGRIGETIIMAQEMVDGITFKLHTSRIKDPQTRERVIEFQKWVMIMLGMIRRGQLRPIRVPKDASIPHQVYDFLALKEYRGRGKFQKQACEALGWSQAKFYKMVDLARKSCDMLPELNKKTGQPRKPRLDKGKTKYPGEKERAVSFFFANREKFGKHGNRFKELPQKSIKELLKLQADVTTINRWIRSHKLSMN
ncbi:MAG: hypothetical protein E3K29_06690 [Candidatus Brocadia sp.]|nr:hypothetical protein [Candidatus Brocadia sp.]